MTAPNNIWVIEDKDEYGGRQGCSLWGTSEFRQDSTDKIYRHPPVAYTRSDLIPDMIEAITARIMLASAAIDIMAPDCSPICEYAAGFGDARNRAKAILKLAMKGNT